MLAINNFIFVNFNRKMVMLETNPALERKIVLSRPGQISALIAATYFQITAARFDSRLTKKVEPDFENYLVYWYWFSYRCEHTVDDTRQHPGIHPVGKCNCKVNRHDLFPQIRHVIDHPCKRNSGNARDYRYGF